MRFQRKFSTLSLNFQRSKFLGSISPRPWDVPFKKKNSPAILGDGKVQGISQTKFFPYNPWGLENAGDMLIVGRVYASYSFIFFYEKKLETDFPLYLVNVLAKCFINLQMYLYTIYIYQSFYLSFFL
jgi:hypothetical protein